MAEQALPEYQRSASVESASSSPDFAGAADEYANSATSFMSTIGAQVAQGATTALMTHLGYEAGQNPTGKPLFPAVTDAQKTFQNAYNSQAKSTLTLQANKLLLDSQTQVNRANLVTPGLISKANQQVKSGLDAILQNAPPDVKGELAYSFNSQAQSNTYNMTNKMISQQKEIQKSTLQAAIATNQENTYNLASQGNVLEAHQLAASTENTVNSGIAAGTIDPVQGKIAIDTARQTLINGKLVAQTNVAQANGTLDNWKKDFANATPESMGMTQSQKDAAGSAVMTHLNQMESMRSSYGETRVANLEDALIKNPAEVTPAMVEDVKQYVTPEQRERVDAFYIRATQGHQQKQNMSAMIANPAVWSNPSLMTRVSTDAANEAFDYKVNNVMASSNSPLMPPMSREDAEVQVAARAGIPIKRFTDSLANNALSGSIPDMMMAGRQYQKLYDMKAGNALRGLDSKASLMLDQAKILSNVMPEDQAYAQARSNMQNITSDQIDTASKLWDQQLSLATGRGKVPQPDFALKKFGKAPADFLNQNQSNYYGTQFLVLYKSNFIASGGDDATATARTQKEIDQEYGYTWVNGKKTYTQFPIEQSLGYDNKDATPVIHQDLSNYLTKTFESGNELYKKGLSHEAWKVNPIPKNNGALSFFEDNKPLTITRMQQTPSGVKEETYPVILNGTGPHGWVVAYQTPGGIQSLMNVDPKSGYGQVNYFPNKDFIDKQMSKQIPKNPLNLIGSMVSGTNYLSGK